MHQKLVLYHCLTLMTRQEYRQCIHELLLEIRYFKRGLSKLFKKPNFVFDLDFSHFNGNCYEKHMGTGTSYQFLNIFRSSLSLTTHHLGIFYVLIQRGQSKFLQKLQLVLYVNHFMMS